MTGTDRDRPRRVLVLVNPRSGLPKSFNALRRALNEYWDNGDADVAYQFSQSVEDGTRKVRRAVERGTDVVLVAGGDGTVSTVGRVLAGTDAAMGAIPLGSGNGFARHFGIPLRTRAAVAALAAAPVRRIDLGLLGETPFLVTCSMAWDASLVQSFQSAPFRGILPYVFAGVHQFFQYESSDFEVCLDGGETLPLRAPMVFTVANLTQFGGGARIAPQARDDDGCLELVVTLKQDAPLLVANIAKLFDGSLASLPQVISRRFRRMTVRRSRAGPIQMDGELIEAPAEVSVSVWSRALNVLAPAGGPPHA